MNGGLDGLGNAVEAVLTAAQDQAVFACLALFLAAVFILSGVPKVRRPELAALAMVDFGVLRRPKRSAGLALGGGELGLALLLGVAAGATSMAVRLIPAVCATVLLWTFVALIARALRSPERFSCACFGSSGETISMRTLLRTSALALAATLLATAASADGSAPSVETWTLALVVATSALGTATLFATIRPINEVRS